MLNPFYDAFHREYGCDAKHHVIQGLTSSPRAQNVEGMAEFRQDPEHRNPILNPFQVLNWAFKFHYSTADSASWVLSLEGSGIVPQSL